MSKIVVVVSDVSDPKKVLAVLRDATGRGLTDLSNSLEMHAPVAQVALFGNDHDSAVAVLKKIMDGISPSAAKVRLFELDPSASFESADNHRRQEITSQTLRNILDGHDRELERQRGLGSQGR